MLEQLVQKIYQLKKMNKYLISYDLGLPETIPDYKRVTDYIKTFSFWAKPLQSVWFVLSEKSASVIRDELKTRIDQNDKIFVIEVKGHWATSGINSKVTGWMQKNI